MNVNVATPEEIGGDGWTITAGFSETPFGGGLLAECPRGICWFSFFQSPEKANHWKALQARWSSATWVHDDVWAAKRCRDILNRDLSALKPLSIFMVGTDFQIRVWQALQQVPFGTRISYSELADKVDNPKASRAVGSAVGQNRVGFLVPCHRVVCSSGDIGNYRWGGAIKCAMLNWEKNSV